MGDITQSGDERVVGHELQGTTCVTLYEPTTTVEKFLPSANQATTTVAIAVIATAGAAATPLLLRLIKPIIKKLTTTAQKKLGRHRELSKSEIITNKYREKKGLPPLKIKRNHNLELFPIEISFRSLALPLGVILCVCSPTTPGGLISITSAHTL